MLLLYLLSFYLFFKLGINVLGKKHISKSRIDDKKIKIVKNIKI